MEELKNVVVEKEVANNKVNKVSAKKATAKAKANSTIKLSVDSILSFDLLKQFNLNIPFLFFL